MLLNKIKTLWCDTKRKFAQIFCLFRAGGSPGGLVNACENKPSLISFRWARHTDTVLYKELDASHNLASGFHSGFLGMLTTSHFLLLTRMERGDCSHKQHFCCYSSTYVNFIIHQRLFPVTHWCIIIYKTLIQLSFHSRVWEFLFADIASKWDQSNECALLGI